MFGWFKGKPKRPPAREMAGRVASLIDVFIEQCGWADFSEDRLYVIVRKDYSVCIAEKDREIDRLLAVPLQELNLQFSSNASGMMRHMAIDMAATTVVNRLPQSN